MSVEIPRVLLIEDDEPIRHYIEMLLEDERIDVVSCNSRIGARNLLADWEAKGEKFPDLILMDLLVPGTLDSVGEAVEEAGQFAREYLCYNPGARFILMTAAANVPGKPQWAADVVEKPFDCEDFINTVHLLISGKIEIV